MVQFEAGNSLQAQLAFYFKDLLRVDALSVYKSFSLDISLVMKSFDVEILTDVLAGYDLIFCLH